jgi:hypothetical protein
MATRNVIVTAMVACLAVAGLSFGAVEATSQPQIVVHTVTRTVTKTVPVVQWKTRTVTKTVQASDPTATPSWYGTYTDPEWECIGNLMQQYISVANGGWPSDTGMFAAECPGVNLPNG